ncbi:hypothetical protein CAEBREN_22907 [Caenorhabditis brenneri]|uniref:Uncharacterized protein n=1 Tax=Caenorhabditis brenneri TaxID=135651 RepID=G0MWH1_CAEBE|nr:hypothetical protein CAEBREN_22907 [Caenorhabditis brenneri]
MSRPTSKKKEALRLYTKFKKTYESIDTSDIRLLLKDTPCDMFWSENCPSDDDVANEIVKLVGQDSIEMKVVFANLKFGHFNIPQKKWFLGSVASTTLLPRQPCNMFGYYCSTLLFGQPNTTCFIHLYHLFCVLKTERRIRMLDTNVSITLKDENSFEYNIDLQGDDCMLRTNGKGLFNKEQRKKFQKYKERSEFAYNGHTISLIDGKLVSTKPIVVYMDDEKIEQRILQWELKNGKQDVFILFETYFMGTGKIKMTNTGFLINCHELKGSYGTGKFSVNPDFTYLVRETAINKTPESGVRKVDTYQLSAVIKAIEKQEDIIFLRNLKKPRMNMRTDHLLGLLCAYSHSLIEMKKQFRYDLVPEMHLSPFELFVHNYHKCAKEEHEENNRKTDKGTPIMNECEALHQQRECWQIKNLIKKCKKWMKIKDNKRDAIDNEFLYVAQHLLEHYLIGIILDQERLIPNCVDENIRKAQLLARNDDDNYFPHPFDYYPFGMFILDRPVEEMDFAIDCLTHDIAKTWFKHYDKLGRTMAITLEKRPGLILFHDDQLDLPVQLIKDFSAWYQVEVYDKMNPKSKTTLPIDVLVKMDISGREEEEEAKAKHPTNRSGKIKQYKKKK